MTKFLNIDLDTKLGGSTPSDVLVSSQKAIKTYVDTKLLEETTRAQDAEAGLNTRVSTNEDDIAMNKDEIGTLNTDMSTAKIDITNLKTSVNTQATLISNLQDGKQDKIDDLDTIVAGAAAGATAVQPEAIADMETKTHASATYQPKGDYATKTELATDLATKADTTTVNTELAKKQDKLVSGTNIKTVNGETLLGSGNIQIESGGAMPVGAIFTTPRTGTIEGAVEANGNEYNIADYSGVGSIGALLVAGGIAYVSKAEFQTQVANTGACDSFGWNGTTDTFYAWTAASVTRVAQPVSEETYYTKSTTPAVGDNLYYAAGSVSPAKIVEVASDYIVTDLDEGYYNHIRDTSKDIAGTSDPTFLVPKLNPWRVGKNVPVIGNGKALGLTNGTQSAGLISRIASTTSTLLDTSENALGTDVGTISTYKYIDSSNKAFGVTTDSTKSGMVADLSETTNLRVMVQLATGATDQALETCTSVLSDVSALKLGVAGLNAHRVIEFQAPTAANNYTWYRKYADRWVEQGGRYPNRQNISTTMPVEMSDTNYSVVLTYETDSTYSPQYVSLSTSISKTTTSFTIRNAGSIFGGWQVSGIAAV